MYEQNCRAPPPRSKSNALLIRGDGPCTKRHSALETAARDATSAAIGAKDKGATALEIEMRTISQKNHISRLEKNKRQKANKKKINTHSALHGVNRIGLAHGEQVLFLWTFTGKKGGTRRSSMYVGL